MQRKKRTWSHRFGDVGTGKKGMRAADDIDTVEEGHGGAGAASKRRRRVESAGGGDSGSRSCGWK
jgi:hypothetical protein